MTTPKKKNILLVDDDADDQLFFLDALKEVNSDVTCDIANNGQEALDALRNHPIPDLIFLDLNMPVMNGFDCLIEVRKKEELQNIPVVIFTTTSDLATIRQMYELGANAFFKKPNEYSIMLSKLNELLNSNHFLNRINSVFSFAEFSI